MVTLLWIICLIYVLIPADLAPGPVDDVIVTFVVWGFTSIMSKGNKDIEDKNK
jgi:hypothetical protein